MTNTVNDIRSKFLDFFEKNGHTKVPASSLVPHNDPTMMFVNSGMVQFKNVFTGLEKRDYVRATSCQKSVRAGGKHNDLENVGYTARHHTFFEMLGNFSFGDYFKEEAIYYAWELLTKEYGLDKNKLYATVYHTDEEAAGYWKKIANFGDDRIIRINTNDNFWSMGDTGPCGPCSEIFYDHGDKIWGGLPGTPEQDGDRYIEIWNMVFMQYEQVDKETRIDLPKKSIDTGMGLERLATVLQGLHNNYEIDTFEKLLEASQELTHKKVTSESIFSHRVIADHLRSSAFLIADGIMPSNEGRGYVLRRIIRRAVRHANQIGTSEPLLYKMLPTLISQMGDAYPELRRAESFVREVLKSEEERFKTTLDRGLRLLEDESSKITIGGTLNGSVAFKLYDTYGFPLDLTEDILKKREITVDKVGFDSCMLEQKERARKSWSGSGESKTDNKWFDIKEKCGSTEFLGYSLDHSQAIILSIIKNGEEVLEAKQGEECIIITNQTPFYGESGGQMGDVGTISTNSSKATVTDTKKYLGSIIAHMAKVDEGKLSVSDTVDLQINVQYRNKLRSNHSATHLLHKVLRSVLGNHVTQKGSLVSHDKLRFDISHPKAISNEDLEKIETLVNEMIIRNDEVATKLMSVDDAIESGAMALFGEKYDDEVRVVSMGNDSSMDQLSVELCGGTHAKRTGDIGLFKILSESAIAAGVRRIEAITGIESLDMFTDSENLLNELANTLKSSKSEITSRVNDIIDSKKQLEKEIGELRAEKIKVTKEEISGAIKADDALLLVKYISKIDSKSQRIAAEDAARENEHLVLVSICDNDGKISIIVSCGSKIAESKPASSLVGPIAALLGGTGGGGNARIAQAGGSKLIPKKDLEKEIIDDIT